MRRRGARSIVSATTALALALALALGLATARASRAQRSEDVPPLPQRLSQTGLYLERTLEGTLEGTANQVRPEVQTFSPQYPLWSDGTRKRRWIWLPPGSFIDASRPDAWSFPPGTRLWKEFGYGRPAAIPVETRLIERLADGSWRFATYVWNADSSDAELAPPEGITVPVRGAPGGSYVIPAEADCRACHEGARVPVLGFSALQLSPDRDPHAPHAGAPDQHEQDLPSLVRRGWLRHLPRALLDRPPRIAARSVTERAALGYLHANCGHCHNATDSAPPVELRLAQEVARSGGAEVLRSLLDRPASYVPEGSGDDARVVAPGHAHKSVLAARMRSRDPQVQMPPLGTRLADPEGLALIGRWISQLPTLPAPPSSSTSQERTP